MDSPPGLGAAPHYDDDHTASVEGDSGEGFWNLRKKLSQKEKEKVYFQSACF